MTKMVYSLKRGAPPLDQLQMRISMVRTWVPKPSSEADKDVCPVYSGYDGPTNLLEALQYDAEGLAEGAYDPTELFDGNEQVVFELVDQDGNVWTECNETITEDDL